MYKKINSHIIIVHGGILRQLITPKFWSYIKHTYRLTKIPYNPKLIRVWALNQMTARIIKAVYIEASGQEFVQVMVEFKGYQKVDELLNPPADFSYREYSNGLKNDPNSGYFVRDYWIFEKNLKVKNSKWYVCDYLREPKQITKQDMQSITTAEKFSRLSNLTT